MKVNCLLVAFIAIVGMQTAFATIIDIVNLDSEQRDKLVRIHLYFTDAAGNMGWCDVVNMRYQEERRIDSATDGVFANLLDWNTAKLNFIELFYFYGEYNATEPLDRGNPLWTNKINPQWSSKEISERRRWIFWGISEVGKLYIPAATSTFNQGRFASVDTANIAQIRIHSHGKLEIIQHSKTTILQGKLGVENKEDV